MRARLVIIFTIPIVLLFVVLGAGYVTSETQAGQQQVYLDRLSDASYLAVTARQSLAADDPSMIEGDLERYREVYGAGAAVLNQAGETWASNGLDVQTIDGRFDALAGRRGELSERIAPWQLDDVIVAEPVFDGGDLVGAVITVSSLDRLAGDIWRLWMYLAAGAVVIIAVSLLVAHWLARWVLRPVRMVETAVTEIGGGALGARIPDPSGPPELRQVVRRFNGMAEKVEQLVHKQQEFVANASHELRNPLNALLLRVEDLGLSLPDRGSDEIEHVRAEGRRMARILDALLMLARDEDMASGSEPVDVVALVRRRVDGWRPIAAEQGVEIRQDAPDVVWARIDEIVLESAFDAVAENAVKFSPRESVVDVGVSTADGMATVTVRDHGPGLPAADLDNMTERFWRAQTHRAVRGSGLGLAIAAQLLDSCGGRLEVALADPVGLAVCLVLPAPEEAT